MSKALICFQRHRNGASTRGIEFKFTFEDWCIWWETYLGPDWLNKRGPRWDQYVMARNGDRGAYEIGNVKCVLSTENHKQQKENKSSNFGERHYKARLTEKDVIKIRKSNLSSTKLSKMFNVSNQHVCDIRNRKRWTHL